MLLVVVSMAVLGVLPFFFFRSKTAGDRPESQRSSRDRSEGGRDDVKSTKDLRFGSSLVQ